MCSIVARPDGTVDTDLRKILPEARQGNRGNEIKWVWGAKIPVRWPLPAWGSSEGRGVQTPTADRGLDHLTSDAGRRPSRRRGGECGSRRVSAGLRQTGSGSRAY